MSQPMGPAGGTARGGTADKLKDRYSWLQSFSDDELREINYCLEGEMMRRDEAYFDISNPEQGVIQGEEGTLIPEGSCYVAKSEIRRDLWEKLTGQFA